MGGILDKVFGNDSSGHQVHLYVAFIILILTGFLVCVRKGLGPGSVI